MQRKPEPKTFHEAMDELNVEWQKLVAVVQGEMIKIGVALLPAAAFGCRFTNHWFGSGWAALVIPRGRRCQYCGAEQ